MLAGLPRARHTPALEPATPAGTLERGRVYSLCFSARAEDAFADSGLSFAAVDVSVAQPWLTAPADAHTLRMVCEDDRTCRRGEVAPTPETKKKTQDSAIEGRRRVCI